MVNPAPQKGTMRWSTEKRSSSNLLSKSTDSIIFLIAIKLEYFHDKNGMRMETLIPLRVVILQRMMTPRYLPPHRPLLAVLL